MVAHMVESLKFQWRQLLLYGSVEFGKQYHLNAATQEDAPKTRITFKGK